MTGATGGSAAVEDLLRRARTAYLDTSTPTPPGLVETAMRTVTSELRPARRIALPSASAVQGFATDVAVANALRLALDDEPAFVARRCRVEADAGAVRVRVSVAVSYALWHRTHANVVRERIGAAVRDLFGVAVDAVDIEIVDLVEDTTGERA